MIVPDSDDGEPDEVVKRLNQRRQQDIQMHGKIGLFDQIGIPGQRRGAQTDGTGEGLPGDDAAKSEKMVVGAAAIENQFNQGDKIQAGPVAIYP